MGLVDQQDNGTKLIGGTHPIHRTSLPLTVVIGLAVLRMVYSTGLDTRPRDSDVSLGVLVEIPS